MTKRKYSRARKMLKEKLIEIAKAKGIGGASKKKKKSELVPKLCELVAKLCELVAKLCELVARLCELVAELCEVS